MSRGFMQAKAIRDIVINVLDDMKAIDIKELDVREMTSITDIMVICSGTSSRHVKAIVNNIVEKVKESDVMPLSVEGETQGEWALVDLGDVIVHIMVPEARDFYNLEKLWSVVELARESSNS